MGDHVFFYGTLMAPFNRPGRQRITPKLTFKGRGRIRAALYDLGIYPAAIPAEDNSTVWGETYEISDAESVLAVLDEMKATGRTSPIAASTRACWPTSRSKMAGSRRPGPTSTTRLSGAPSAFGQAITSST